MTPGPSAPTSTTTAKAAADHVHDDVKAATKKEGA